MSYEFLPEEQIPRCCGACDNIRYKGRLCVPFCKLQKEQEESICVFGICEKYRKSKFLLTEPFMETAINHKCKMADTALYDLSTAIIAANVVDMGDVYEVEAEEEAVCVPVKN